MDVVYQDGVRYHTRQHLDSVQACIRAACYRRRKLMRSCAQQQISALLDAPDGKAVPAGQAKPVERSRMVATTRLWTDPKNVEDVVASSQNTPYRTTCTERASVTYLYTSSTDSCLIGYFASMQGKAHRCLVCEWETLARCNFSVR
jgi:hypothetical protein